MAISPPKAARAQPETGPPGQGEGPPCTAVDERLNFPAYWVGPSFDGLPLTSVLRNCGGPRVNSVDYVYGTCDASRGGCSAPVDIQNWPPELRNRRMYSEGPGLFQIRGTDTFVDGVPAFRVGGHQLEIYHPKVTVVIFANRDRVDRIAAALVEGPKVLIKLARYGFVFNEGCLNGNYCEGKLPGEDGDFAESIAFAVLLFLVGPILGVLFRPKPVPSA